MGTHRINWIDHSRGLSIILVVMMHSTLGVEKVLGYEGWMHHVVSFATPFRIPAFFLVSGLLLGSALHQPLRSFIDRRVTTLFYLYALWLTIQFAFKTPSMFNELGLSGTVGSYFFAFVQPFGTLWFIYVLPIFFVLARLAKPISPWLVLTIALLMHLAPIETGWLVIDEVSDRFFYFYLGHCAVRYWHLLAEYAVDYPRLATFGLLIWAATHGLHLGYATMPIINVAFSIFGAAALITAAALLRHLPGMELLRWIGRNTVVVYLGFFLPMAISRTILIKLDIFDSAGTISALTTVGALLGAVVMFLLARKIGIASLIYRKPGLIFSQAYVGVDRRKKTRFRMTAAE